MACECLDVTASPKETSDVKQLSVRIQLSRDIKNVTPQNLDLLLDNLHKVSENTS